MSQISYLDVSKLRSVCGRPGLLAVTQLLRQWMTQHFSNVENIRGDRKALFGNKIWTDDNSTGILIESYTAFNPQKTEVRPAIVIKRLKYQRVSLGMGDRFMPTKASPGESLYEVQIAGGHVLFCLGVTPGEAELVAAEVWDELLEHGEAVRENCGFTRFRVIDADSVGILKESGNHFVVPITVAYRFRRAWRVTKPEPVTAVEIRT